MPVEHVAPDAAPEAIAEILARDGCAVVDGLAKPDQLDRFRSEMQPWLDATRLGPDTFTGKHTPDSELRAREASTAVLDSLAELPGWLGLTPS